MNKKRKEFPKKLIGHRVVRIRETVEKDFSYKDDFVIIKEVTPNEELVVVTSSGKEKLLPIENDKIKVTKKGKIKTTKIGYFFDCKK